MTGSATDPSTAVNTAGYTYNWTVTGPSTTLSGTGTPYSFTPEYGGTYTVSLTATDQLNKLTSKAFTSTFSVTNVTPTASFTGLPSSSPSGTAITLTASATDPSTAVNNKGYVFNWSVSGPNTNLTGTGATYTFIPEYGGSYTVTLTATDQLNELTSAKASSTTVISNVAPSPSFTGLPTSSPCGTAIVLTGTATDPSTADTAAGFTFSWTVTGPGTVTFTGSSSTASPKFTFTPIVGGKYSVLMTATDSDKLSGSTTQAFTVNDIAPSVLTLSAPSSVSEAATFSTSATFSDPDPTVTHTALWTWGDGTTSAGAIIAPNGSTPGSVTGSHLYSIPGAFTVTLTVTGSDSLTGKATAQITTNRSIILLDPTSSGALSLSGNSSINIPGSVFVNSKSSTAVVASGNATVKASGVFIVGGDQVSGNASLGTVTKGSTAIVDPLASLPAPTAGTTQTPVNLSGNSTETINPGDYCQISVSGNAVLTMNAGVYIITGGGLTISGNASISGTGVMIYNASASFPATSGTYTGITLSGNGSTKLTAPTSGTYSGILICQPSGNTKAMTISGNGEAGMSGVIYAPSASLTLSGNAQESLPLDVDDLIMSGNAVSDIMIRSVGSGIGPLVSLPPAAIVAPVTAGDVSSPAGPTLSKVATPALRPTQSSKTSDDRVSTASRVVTTTQTSGRSSSKTHRTQTQPGPAGPAKAASKLRATKSAVLRLLSRQNDAIPAQTAGESGIFEGARIARACRSCS